ncbi:hypothetical protein EWM64_g4917 [Hericium alpestre]|uniref:Uncharacterized protein n=1 Tax=Hericium alpestre TaxID=135208 RepID=A0A4Y9ZY20_9AGAM|nr:hypothetical protein EWM64_g4917 [Hericium alpestre]
MIFTSDFKLGHYMKVPPRPMFWAQVVSTAIAGLVQLGVQEWVFSNIDFPLIFAGLGLLPPANASNFVPWAILGFIFQFIIRRRFFPFWAKYNYVLSAALDAGTAVGVILVYFW